MVFSRFRMSVMAGIFLCASSSLFAYSGGSGTAEDPYQISTIADWIEIMNTQSDWDANFIMTADINLQDVPLIPVGNDLNGTYIYFRGIFEGNGHIIRNATITRGYLSTGIGVFGRISSDSQIRNLGAEDVNMSGGARVGGLVGCSYGTISNCFATGKVSQTVPPAGTGVGGLVGKNFGTITGSHAACQVDGDQRIGGLVGWNIGTIIDSYADGTANGNKYVGGLAGENDCETGEPSPGMDYNGIGTIARCYAAGSVSGNSCVGGLAGTNGGGPSGYPGVLSITDCYSICTVTGGAGLAARNNGHITNCYAAGPVSGTGGGLISFSPIPASNSFWDIEATGQTASGSGTGLTTAQMKTLSTFTSAGWDFVDTWGIGENQTYPFVRTYSGTDLNYDGLVNLIDFAVWANHWLEGI